MIGDDKVARLYSDNHPSLINAGAQLELVHELSTPHEHENNAIIENFNGQILRESRTALLQAGLPASYWPLAVSYVCVVKKRLRW
jgi:hypothetical protein